jgi:cytochrome P450
VDLQTLFFQLTLDSATEFLLGESINSLTAPQGSPQQLFGQAFDLAQNKLPDRLRLGPFVWLHRDKEFTKACSTVHGYIDNFVEKALRVRRESQEQDFDVNEKGKYIFVNELARATDDPIRIRSELLNILLAGRDTTAGILSNTFHVLARRQDIWAKLTAEVDQLNGEKPSYEILRNLKYLKYCLNECKYSNNPWNLILIRYSASPIPFRPKKWAFRQQEHYTSSGRWTRWSISHIHTKG